MTMTNSTAVKDLVCGMDVDPASAEARSEHQGETYYFCSASCKETFDANPARYIGQSAPTPKSGGCCS
jgi:YHS domain-containing protein